MDGPEGRLGLIPESISEFRVSSNLNAEHGWNLGSGVEMVMRSGTNDFHGSVFEYFRNDALDARNFFATDVASHNQNEWGGVIAGRSSRINTSSSSLRRRSY